MTMTALDRVGTIISWKAPKEITFTALQDALQVAGLNPAFVRQMLPRHAFSRAATEMSEARVIKKVREDKDAIWFQFTKEYLDSGEWRYHKEATLRLCKSSGDVTSYDDYTLAHHAAQLVSKHIGLRTAADVSRIVQKTVDSHGGDLVPLREQGGVYFVPEHHSSLVDSIATFLAACGGKCTRFVLHGGDANTDASIAEAMAAHITSLVNDFRSTCEAISKETDVEMLLRRCDAVKGLRAKLTAYASLLDVHASTLSAEVDAAEMLLLNKFTN